MDLSKVLPLQKNFPAAEKDILFSEESLLGEIPEVYKQFLRKTNGMVLNNCVLYDTESIVEMYNTNEFIKYAPGYLSIGNDNGDRELVMKAEKNACDCGFLDAGAIGTAEPDEWFDFVSWVENGCNMLEEKELTQWGNVSIIKIPDDKLKFLMETKKVFGLSISTGVLLKEINRLPYTIVRGITEAKAKRLMNRTGFSECYQFFLMYFIK